MSLGILKNQFWISFFVWVACVVLFFAGLSQTGPGDTGGVVALITFVVGVVSFFYGLNKLILVVNNMGKLRLWSFLVWILTLVIFGLTIWNSSQVVEHQIFKGPYWAGVALGDIILGVAAFLAFIASFATVIPKKHRDEDRGNGHSYVKTSLSSKISDELDDIIFIPKKKQGFGVGVIVVGAILLGLLAINAFGGESNGTGQSPSPSVVATLSQLTLVDPKITGNNSQAFTGTVKNSSKNLAVDVVLRVDFSKDKEGKQQFDTRYFTIDYVAANGAFTFNLPFDLNYRGQYWWNSKIETAEFK